MIKLKKIKFSDDSESFYHYDWMGMREWVEDRYGIITRHYWWTLDFGGLPHVIGSVKKVQEGTETTNFVYGQGLLAREIDNTFTYFLIGDNDNVITLADDNGDITDRYEYSTFGKLLSHTGSDTNRILFSTEPNDDDSGLIYLRNRYYDPGVGRFVSGDQLYDFGVNRYNYCYNNPVGWNDPSGLKERKNALEVLRKARSEGWTKKKWGLMASEDGCTMIPFSAYSQMGGKLYRGINSVINQEFKKKKISPKETPLIWAYTRGSESLLIDLRVSYSNNPNPGDENKAWKFAPVQYAYTYKTKTPRPGDLAHFKWSDKTEFTHVGVVDRVDRGKIYVTHLTEQGSQQQGNYYWGIVVSENVKSIKGEGDIVEYGVVRNITDP